MRLQHRSLAAIALTGVALLAGSSECGAGLIGPTPYLSFADSPFKDASFSYFHLEDFEDGLLNTPGLSVDHGMVTKGDRANDSVDGDIGGIDGSGSYGGTIFDVTSMTFTFDANALGALPTSAGLVYTDSDYNAKIIFEAFDQNGVSLGKVSAILGDASFYGETAEDRFFGVTHAGGISRIFITDSGEPNGIEVDHVQYGLDQAVVPEPASLLLALSGAIGLFIGHRLREPSAA